MTDEELIEAVAGMVKGYVADAVAKAEARISALEARPMPERGEKGADGANGKDGTNGMDGKDGSPGQDGQNGADGKDGANGRDGASVTADDIQPMLEAKFATWALECERRASDQVRHWIDHLPKPKDGKDGRDGIDGKDGLSLEDWDVDFDGERAVTFRLVRGELAKGKTFVLPYPIDRGIWNDATEYQRGDVVTFGGSASVAEIDRPPGKPGTEGSGWRLMVRKGRDAK